MKKDTKPAKMRQRNKDGRGNETIHPGNGPGGKENGQPVEKEKEARISMDIINPAIN